MAEDFPAFIVNRILVPMINEAVYALYEGVGSVAGIDTSMKLGANHPMGPLELADFIGLDTCLSIMQVLYEGLSDSKYRPCPLLVKYVEAGWLGRKTNRGFYDYTRDAAAADAVRSGGRFGRGLRRLFIGGRCSPEWYARQPTGITRRLRHRKSSEIGGRSLQRLSHLRSRQTT